MESDVNSFNVYFSLCFFYFSTENTSKVCKWWLEGGWMVDGGWCFLVSVFIFIFSDEIQTKWNLTIIVFDLFKEKWNFWNPVAKFDK